MNVPNEAGIIPWYMGGLGNQLFVVVAAYITSRVHDCPLYIPKNTIKNNPHNRYNHDYTESIFKYMGTHIGCTINEIIEYLLQKGYVNRDCPSAFSPWSPLNYGPASILRSYFQYYPPILAYETEIRTLLLKGLEPFRTKLRETYDVSNAAFLHVRRGDYLKHPTIHYNLPIQYYMAAINMLLQSDSVPSHIYVLSDDPEWILTQPFFQRFHIVTKKDELETMALMSLCSKGAILANSTFSWWGAFLGSYAESSPVYIPEKWISEPINCLFPSKWISVPCKSPGTIQFTSTKHNGGYGDRLIGMASAATIANILGYLFRYTWEPDFMNHCKKTESTMLSNHDEVLNLYNIHNSSILEEEDLLTRWSGKTVTIHANIPIHGGLWKNPYLKGLLKDRPYDTETIQSFQQLFSKYIQFSNPFPAIQYNCGIQIRVGDTYCMPHNLAEQYIPNEAFPAFACSMKAYLQQRGIKGLIYLTSDTFHIYKYFTELNDSEYTFVFRDRSDDIHFDFHNSNNRYKEILEDHYSLMNCKTVITGLRSNFGTTAAYCSSICSELVFYTSDWKETIQYKSYNSKDILVLKEYKKHLTDGTPSIETRLNLGPLIHV